MTTPTLTVHRPHLLVVDDEPSIAELLKIWFEPLGWDVTTASSGPEGVAAPPCVRRTPWCST